MVGAKSTGVKRQHREDDEFAIEDAPLVDAAASATAGKQPKSKRQRLGDSSSLFVRSLPPDATSESLTEFFSQHFPVKHAVVVSDPATKASRGYGFVTFADAEDTKEAQNKLNNVVWNKRKLRLEIAEARKRKPGTESEISESKAKRLAEQEEARRPPKLIIRNLPWSVKKPEHLAKLFSGFGKVKFADVPNDKGKLSGFGFITMRGRKNAEKALAAINGKEIDGRTIAVDWAVDKDTYQKQQQVEATQRKEAKAKAKEAKKNESGNKESNDAKDDEDELAGMTEAERDIAMFFKNTELESEKEEDSSDDSDDDSDSSPDKDDDTSEKAEDEDEWEDDISEEQEKPQKRITDNSSTVFVRNLPFSATDDTLKTFFGKFGAVRYARVVMDKTTDRPAGTGFVCFFNVPDSITCVKGAPRITAAPAHLSKKVRKSILTDESVDIDGKYTMDGRILQVTQAVSKDEATRMTNEGAQSRREKDKRRLFLLNEGALDQRSSLYRALTPSEIKIREASASQRKKLVQANPMLHISLTRLAVRNLPKSMGTKELKQLAREAVVGFATDVKEGRREPLSKEEKSRGVSESREAEQSRKARGKGIVKQAKIEFESIEGSKMPEKDGARSRGYGFIEYSSHRWALMGLRYLNGFQVDDTEGRKKRLIVEFAIENAQVVARRAQQGRNKPPQTAEAPTTEKKPFGRHDGKPNFKASDKDGRRDNKFNRRKSDQTPRKQDDTGNKQRNQVIARKMVMRKKKKAMRG
ncbi:Nucleolar protein 4 [Ceratocystis fimbriata CBS 114723]|uniref:Nucleolar protein 4 n=1 Tax=Ceratocystis fimbriata CBS 114723 TaxID=1035309 RepID=A0A2C5X3P6_9PEZI|nr:Nucleolar protein 4 [Ceratocystis fimbriata CBS 114723]